ncbi:MAG: haloacid dehalogenase type II [Streptosporangiales bacterium]|nr:haloacid dehalogenase type II [Streptosporangiales bacterium]
MAHKPSAIAFDVIETLFPLEPLRRRITDVGLPGHVLELWFTRLLRDGFVLAATGGYRPFPQIALAALGTVTGYRLTDEQSRQVLAGFGELDPHPDVEPALRRAHEAGVQVVTLTNGSAETTAGLLRRAGLDGYVERTLSVDDVQRWKPSAAVYLHAASVCDLPPDRVALVAAHAWDTHGARQAGLVTGWVSRLEQRVADVFAPPDVTGDDLPTVVDGLLALPD